MKKNHIVFKFLIFLILLIYPDISFAVVEENASFQQFLYGETPQCEYDNWISHIAEGIASPGYNIYAPFDRQTDGFGDFLVPSASHLTHWGNIIDIFLNGDLETAQDSIDFYEFPYRIVIFNDTDQDRTYHLLREIPNPEHYDDNGTSYHYDDETGAFDYGWGLYVYYPAGPNPHIITAPHPTDDFPTVPFAHKAFVEQQSKFLLISGAGREVAWTEIGDYSNSKSLSDPSRTLEHPFNVAYQKFCDLIREEFEQREFSLQIHTCDWGSRHWDYPDVQISGGFYVGNPDLPIRDHSSRKLDIINASDFVIHPANSVGIHPPVYLNDFYGVHYDEFGFYFSDEDTTVTVNNHMDLEGYSGNRQMQYTQQGFSHYDNIEPFFHIEMDELPNIYPQIENNFLWFYGWDPAAEIWNTGVTYDRFLSYYSPWPDALTEILPAMYEMNDNEIPLSPTDLQIFTECSDYIILNWEKGDSYDIDSYEILYATEPISEDNFIIRDKDTDQKLACLATTNHKVTGLTAGQEYYFALRLRDKNGNYSDLSNQISGITGPAMITSFSAYGRDEYVDIAWFVSSQTDCEGFNIYRKQEDGNYTLLDSWLTDPDLQGINENDVSYSYTDNFVENNNDYTYQISFNDTLMNEHFFGNTAGANPHKIYKLVAEQVLGTLSDTCYFGMNPYASDGYDANSYDILTEDEASEVYLFGEFYEENWNENFRRFEQEIYGEYDPQSQVKSWIYRIVTDQLNSEIEIFLADDLRDAERFYLLYNDQWTDLVENSFIFSPPDVGTYTFLLSWGNKIPDLDFVVFPNRLFLPGEIINFEWSLDFIDGIQYIDAYAENDAIAMPVESAIAPEDVGTSWTAPAVLLDDLHLRLDLVMMQNDTVSYRSSDKFGIVSDQDVIETEAGWHLFTQNFDSDLTAEEIYGSEVELYAMMEDGFQEITEPEFLYPYWLHAQQDNYYILNDSQIQKTVCEYRLNEDWNLIPNPHKIEYRLDQLQFILNENTFQYYEALQNHLIEAFVFDYDEKFEPVSILHPRKAYYLYCFTDDLSIRYIPFFESGNIPRINKNWEIEVCATQNSEKSASVIIGTSIAADSLYDPLYDLQKPILAPISDQIVFSLVENFPDMQSEFHRSFRKFIVGQTEVFYEWDARLQIPGPEPVDFSAFELDVPDDLHLYLNLPDGYLELENDIQTFIPADTLIEFTLIVTDLELTNVEEDQSLKLSLFNYPNPFNLSRGKDTFTSISYNVPHNSTVDLSIYNIKGQKVKTLVAEKQEKGNRLVNWFGKDMNERHVASGVYFYKLDIKNRRTIVKKMLLLR